MKTITLDSPKDFLTYREGSGNTVEIFDIQVGTKRGRGRGRKLVDTLLKKLAHPPIHGRPLPIPMVFAITRHNNRIAREFYTAVGFRFVGFLHHFYGVGNDAVMYGIDA